MKTVIIVLLVSAAMILGAVMGAKAKLRGYFAAAAEEFPIPDITRGFIPQGIAYDASSGCFLLTGYTLNVSSSPIYVVNPADGSYKKILMQDEKGGRFKGHAGGLSVYGDSLYIAGSTDYCMYSFPLDEVLGAEDGALLAARGKSSLRVEDDFIRVSFTSVDDDFLYAGEFHSGPLFYTHRSHKVDCGGRSQKAYLFGFSIGEDGATVPECVFSIPDKVQGACFADGVLYLAQARGFLTGRILSYRLDSAKQNGVRTVLGKEVPLYIVGGADTAVTEVPPMPEEIVAVDGRMYIVSESASNLYRFGRSLELERVYSVPLSYFNG